MTPATILASKSSVNRLANGVFSTVTLPHKISNVKTIRYNFDPRQSLVRCQVESRRLRATKVWHEFWQQHNTDYTSKLETLKSKHAAGVMPSNEMSRFYLEHLESTREKHREFNRWWIRENFSLLLAGVRCWFLERVPERSEPGFFGGH